MLTFFPMHWIGLLGMPRRVYTYSADLGLESSNFAATMGSFVIGFSMIVFVINVIKTGRSGEKAGKNPWGGGTLEWGISSPPPVYNFSVIPEVRSLHPMWTENGVSEIPDVPPEPVHVPGGSYWPIFTAVGVTIFFLAPLLHALWPALLGGAITVVGIFSWAFEPFEM